jgi:RNA polymerase sigma-70 factor, ECF subfamily
MQLIKGGHEKALTELYKRYQQLMLRYFHRMLWKDQNKAQDFLQDLFVKIIERPESFNAPHKFSTWFYSVAHNICKNEYRKQSFRDSVQTDITVSEKVENAIHEQIDSRSFRKCVEKAMDQWPEDDRSLFVFRFELEMTFSEIAEVLNCPEGTVKSRWFYLKKALAFQFQEFQMTLK